MVRSIRLGVIVPSSNTVLEPLTSAIASSIDDTDVKVSVHYSRIRVTTIDTSGNANAQFSLEPMVAAAHHLADAAVDVIGWSGTSSGWLGFEQDQVLCKAIQKATGIPATSSILSLNELLHRIKSKRLGLVTPYVACVNQAIRKNYKSIGYEITPGRERFLSMTNNFDFGNVDESQIDAMVSEAVDAGADVVAICCTNLRGATRVPTWEHDHAIVVLDSVATTVWGMLQVTGVDPGSVKGWGSLFKT
ncbi:hypothetical protein PV08_06583 [Exophiala spinifera]|uniref:Asp/Glu/hydantoin racemase n=1 Tax=Exophiala spinifera TaxID=91928 RepID=A0A0D2BC46_9EURO|nr:uncharacterized protein PV08_06583 [Exophiala spinifera]KIW16528.1 hypothetical protein PV08_06583 [Exophiala spinifera]